MNILEAIDDPDLFGPWFKSKATWAPWRAFLAALFGLPMNKTQLATYQQFTGRDAPPSAAFDEGWLIIGRRGGKSFMMALIAVFLACFRDYAPYLAPGERATVLVIAADKKQARVILRYVRAMLNQIPMLAAMIENDTTWSIDLANLVTIEVGTASFRSTRGYTYAAVLADEIAFWRTDVDAAEPDYEILDAIRPGMATIPGSVLLGASSPYARRGALWDAFRRWWGKADAPLVWKASTRDMNPTVPQAVIDRAEERDPASASAEYGANFRTDIEALLTREAVAAVVEDGVLERPRIPGIHYSAFVDPSGGSADSMTLGIAHRDSDDQILLDVIRERRPPFSPEGVVAEFCKTLHAYGIQRVTGDRYAGEWPREQFRKLGIAYDLSEKPKSAIYQDLVPTINSAKVTLLDEPRLINQLVGLERRTARGGRDSIDHEPGGHDDVANAAAGAIVMCGQGSSFTLDNL